MKPLGAAGMQACRRVSRRLRRQAGGWRAGMGVGVGVGMGMGMAGEVVI